MKKFYENSKTPLIVGIVAAIVFMIDGVLTRFVWSEAGYERGFVWMAFIVWAVSFGMSNNDRIRLLIGCVIGFFMATSIIHFGRLFDANFIGIAVAATIGVFLFSGLVMYLDHLKKFWINSITGVFIGAPLTFSGLGVGLAPMTFSDGALMLGMIMTYAVLGVLCAFVCVYLMGKWKKGSGKA